MLEKTSRSSLLAATQALTIRRVDAIPVALPLKVPMKMSAETITAAQNLLVRIEAADGTVGWGDAASAPTMTGDTQGGLIAAVRDHLHHVVADVALAAGELVRGLENGLRLRAAGERNGGDRSDDDGSDFPHGIPPGMSRLAPVANRTPILRIHWPCGGL